MNELHDLLIRPSSEVVLSTKLRPPRMRMEFIERGHMRGRLESARHKRGLVVLGPAGAGKTTMLAKWRQLLLGYDIDVAWLSLGPDDGESMRFFNGLFECLAEVDPEIVQGSLRVLDGHGSALADEAWVIGLIQRIANRRRELVLVMDDTHHLRDIRAHRALQWLLDYAPPNLRLSFGSRTPVPVDLGRLRDQAQVEELGASDLRFSAADSRAYLQQQLPTISDRNVREFHALTDGWITGLKLIATESKNGGSRPRQMLDHCTFSTYFETEVLTQLAPEDLNTLTRCAVTQRFSASLGALLAGQSHSADHMRMRLSALDRQNLFVSQVVGQDGESWYRTHPILREVLLARLQAKDAAEVPMLHKTACQWFASRNCMDEAVRHAVAADDADLAAKLVEQCAPLMLSRGAHSQLGAMLVLLPEHVVRERFHLRLTVAQLRLYGRNLPAVEDDVRNIEEDIDLSRPAERFALTLLKGGLAIQKDDSDTIASLQAELMHPPKDAAPIMRVRAGHILSWLYANQGLYDEARAMLDVGDRYESSPDRRLVSASFRGMSFALEGRMPKAERVLREVLAKAQSTPDIDPSISCVAAGLLCETVYEANDLPYALQLAEGQTTLLERAAIPDAVLRSLLTSAAVHRLAGSPEKAGAALDRLEAYARHHSLDRLLAHALALRLRWCLKDGSSREAQLLLRRLEAIAGRHNGAAPGTHLEIFRLTERARARLEIHWNDFASAADRLSAVLPAARSARRWREVATLHMMIAVSEHGRGRVTVAFDNLIQALELGHSLGLVRCLLDVSAKVPGLIEQLLALDRTDPVHTFYAQRLLASVQDARAMFSSGSVQHPAAPSGLRDFSRRECEVLSLAGQAMSNKKIALVLGVTQHTVKFHLGKIYLKLGVARRDQAVARLRAMDSDGLDGPSLKA